VIPWARGNVARARSCAGVPSRRLAAWAMAFALAIPVASAAAESRPYGILVNGIDHTTPRTEIASLLERAREAGAHWIRTDFFWYSVQWSPGPWNWAFFDAVVEEAAARGFDLIPILWGTPRWAALDGVFAYGVPEPSAWESFVGATVARYRGRVHRWEMEPDCPGSWAGSPAQYADLLARAYQRVKLADPTALVVLGGLAQGGDAMTDFLNRILSDPVHPAGPSFDVHNVHTNFRSMG